MARVFVSHASEDRTLAREVHRWLVEAGHEVFLAQDLRDGIALGEEWEQRLHDELRLADAVVCLVTSAYLASRWCTAEVAIARSRGSRLLPIKAESDVADPLLTSVQHADLTRDPDAVRPFLIEALRLVDAAWPDDRSPFPGLRPFDTDQHRVFFGRTEETKELAELLRSPAEHAKGAALLVVGPSGCGKSSLVRAGLLPIMAGEPGWWTLSPIAPGADPVAALVRELAAAARQIGLDPTVAQVRQQLDNGRLRELADELLLAAPGDPRRRLLIVVDQFEELLTQTAPADRARFAELLRPTLDGPVQLVATLRPEFLDQLLADPDLATLPTQVYPLRPLRREALRAVIEKPARLAGIDVDDGLVDRLVDDTDTGEALPLLAFTLAQLADGITRGGRLSSTRYDQLGGVQGALTRQADAALIDAVTAGGRSREQVIAGLLRLVTVDEQGRPTRWRVRRDELPTPVITELDAFVERRLLTTDEGNGSGVVGVVHEAFLSAWPPLAQAITAAASALRARRAVEHAATEWHENHRPPARLWSGGQLAAAVTDTGARIRAGTAPADTAPRRGPSRWLTRRRRGLVTDRVDLSPKAHDFLHASIRHDRHRRRRTITVLSVLLVLALTAAGVAVFQQGRAQEGQRIAQEQQRIATARQLVAQAEATRATNPRTALQLGLAAHRIHPSGETHANLVNTLTSTHYANTLTGPVDTVSVAFAPDGHTLATGGRNIDGEDGTVILWDSTDPTQPRQLGGPLTGHTDSVNSVAFAPDGHTLATSSDDKTVILWDLTDPTQPHRLGSPLTGHTDSVSKVAFAPDGHTMATGSANGEVILWDLTNLTQPHRLSSPLTGTDHTDWVNSVTFAPDGHTLATASDNGTVILWDLTNLTHPRRLGPPLTGHTGKLNSAVFTPAGGTLATSSYDGTVILWDVTDPTQPRQLGTPLTGHTGTVRSVAFAPGGHTIATASDDFTVILWDLTDPTKPRQLGTPLVSHTGMVFSVAFAPDGHALASGSTNGEVILWDPADPTQPRQLGTPLTGHTDSESLSSAFASHGHILATGIDDGTVILWDLTDPTKPHRIGSPLTGHTGLVTSVAFAPDGHTLATSSYDKTVILWDLTDPTKPHRIGSPLTGHTGLVTSVAFASDGRTLATASTGFMVVGSADSAEFTSADDTVILWDLTDPTKPRQLGTSLTGHAHSVSSVAFAPNGHTLATGSYDGTVILWDLTDPTKPRQLGTSLTGHAEWVSSVAFAPDGHTLATGSDNGTVIMWDLTNPTKPRQLGTPLTGHTNPAFAPDGHTLATNSADGTVILWDLTDPTQPGRLSPLLTSQTRSLSLVVFAPDGHTLATRRDDGAVILWDLTGLNYLLAHAVKRGCSIAQGGLDRDEWARLVPGLPYQDSCPA